MKGIAVDFSDLVTDAASPGPICLMGVNGCGKTRLLERLYNALKQQGRPTYFIRAARQAMLRFQSDSSPHDVPLGSHEHVLERVAKSATSDDYGIGQIATISLKELYRIDEQDEGNYIVSVAEWLRRGKSPPEPVPPIKRSDALLDLLGDILGYKLSIYRYPNYDATHTRDIRVEVNGIKFTSSELSDGEKQIFSVAILLLQSVGSEITLFVDEPELHLNEARAVSLWEEIERRLPNVKFVYATHSLTFATRPDVKHLYVMEAGEAPRKVDTMPEIDGEIIRDMVGARIQLRHKDTVPIFCEDEAHAKLLNSLLVDERFEPVVLGSWEKVVAAMRADDVFRKIVSGSGVRLAVIDRDQRSQSEIDGFNRIGVHVLPFNEAESILLHPAVALPYLRQLPAAIDEDGYIKAIVTGAMKALDESLQKLRSAVEQQFPPKIRFERDGSQLTVELAKTEDGCCDEFKSRGDQMIAAVYGGDLDLILSSVKGKALYRHVCRYIRETYGVQLSPPGQQLSQYQLRREFADDLRQVPGLASLADAIKGLV
ncbi:AAA family ATPase [Rhizobium cremeum]|uniref:AAA family ATPase n=1 Tax=Rhizobium cremeum TaxID=2813827 RepID=UPI0039E1EDC4